jgi:hypothetical protein
VVSRLSVNFLIAFITNLATIILAVKMAYVVCKNPCINSFSKFFIDLAIWLWSGIIMYRIYFYDVDVNWTTLAGRLAIMLAFLFRLWIVTRTKPPIYGGLTNG